MKERENLQQQLGELTQWGGGDVGAWRTALERTETVKGARRRRLAQRGAALAMIGAAAVLLVAVTVFDSVRARLGESRRDHAIVEGLYEMAEGKALKESSGRGLSRDGAFLGERLIRGGVAATAGEADNVGEAGGRYVARRASITLRVDDVNAVFARAAQIADPALGEFVEQSSLRGEGAQAQAELTLRVAASRLSEVMNALRQLGDVQVEDTSGTDVTDRVVDLDARLRNSQRVESELLELLESRPEAELEEILKLRRELADVRGEIEGLVGQREKLANMTSLATVLVIIRAEDAPASAPAGAISVYFGHELQSAWRGGLRFLADFSGTTVRVLVGGAPLWASAIVVAVFLKRRRLAART